MKTQGLLNLLVAYLTFIPHEHERKHPTELGISTSYHTAPVFPDEAELLDDWNVDRVILIWLGFSPSDVTAAWFSWNRLHLGTEPDCLARPKSSEYSFVRAAI